MSRALVLAGAVAAVMLCAGAANSINTLDVHLVSQTNSTITLGWTPQTGFGYLFFNRQVLQRPRDVPGRGDRGGQPRHLPDRSAAAVA
jgi:hypothetical protein